MTVGTLVNWLKKEGDPVSNGDMIAEVETDKATMEVECFEDGILIKQYCKEGEEVPVGGAIAAVGEAGEAAPEATSAAPSTESTEVQIEAVKEPEAKTTPKVETPPEEEAPKAIRTTSDRIKASPLAKKIAAACMSRTSFHGRSGTCRPSSTKRAQ